MKKNKKIYVMYGLMLTCMLCCMACTQDNSDFAKADKQEACLVCGETLEPGTFGKEGCYRTSYGEYLTREQAGRYFVSFSNSDTSGMPALPEEERKACPDCGAVLEPGTYGDEGCYRTKSGIYLTKGQYRRMLLGCEQSDIDENTAAAIMGYDHPEYCMEEMEISTTLFDDFYTPTQEDYVHNKPVSEKMTAQKIKEFAEEENRAGDFNKVHQIFYDKEADMWMAELYHYVDDKDTAYVSPNAYYLIFIDGTGVTRDMYMPDDNHTMHQIEMPLNEKKTPTDEVGTFSYKDVHKTEGFVHKGEETEVSMETLADYADEELKNSAYASWMDERYITKLAKQKGKELYRVSYYWDGKPFQSIHIYLTPKGKTEAMYVHEGS